MNDIVKQIETRRRNIKRLKYMSTTSQLCLDLDMCASMDNSISVQISAALTDIEPILNLLIEAQQASLDFWLKAAESDIKELVKVTNTNN